MCVANVHNCNTYFIHITVYTQLFLMCKGKGKAIPLQVWTGPGGSRRSQISRQSAHEGCQLCALVYYMYLILIYIKFHPYPTVMPNVQLLSSQVHIVLYPQKTLHFPNPPLHSGLADTGFVLCSH
jgi:hypothetical protein